MDLDREIESMLQHIQALQSVLKSLEERVRRAKDAWPSHQILPAEWTDRSVTPPVGRVWYSDGINVWLIKSDGKGMGGSPDVCRYWTTAYIPAPPTSKKSEAATGGRE